MVVKLVEVCRSTFAHTNIDGKSTGNYTLKEVFLNPKHIVALREDEKMKEKLMEGKINAELDKRQEFTKVYVDRGQVGFDITVVGNPALVEEKITKSDKRLLHG
tara:strand:- start:843 stop:1154 length:312 start_codon:yes stop_codon:yes gene_type:complete